MGAGWRAATARKYAERTVLRISVSEPEVRVWISFVARYAEVKCLRTLRSNAVRAWVD